MDQKFFLLSSPFFDLNLAFASACKVNIFFEENDFKSCDSLCKLGPAFLVVVLKSLLGIFCDADVKFVCRVSDHIYKTYAYIIVPRLCSGHSARLYDKNTPQGVLVLRWLATSERSESSGDGEQ